MSHRTKRAGWRRQISGGLMAGLLGVHAAVLIGASLAAPPSAAAATSVRGCDPDRPAQAHRAGGKPVRQSSQVLIPCTTVTGNAIEGATIGVSGTGEVFFASIEQFPDGVRTIVDGSVIARSGDRGKSWRNIVPGGAIVSPHGSLSTWLRYEHSTERLWYASPTAPCGGTVSWSDDEGASWRTVPNIGCPAQGGIGMIEGPAPPGTPQPTGYPNIAYYCANAQDGEESVLACHRSRDGGATWSYILSTPDPFPAEAGCPPTRLRTTRVGEVGPDGVLYFPTFSCDDETLGLAVSVDQGETWERRAIAEIEIQDLYPPALAIDSRGRIYIALKGPGGLPHLIVSKDGGTSWSKPMMVAPPGLDEMRRRVGITARGPGDIVLSYLGTTDGGESYDAYVTESRNTARRRPVFYSAVANDPAQSVVAGDAEEIYADRIQLLRPDIADDGTSWAAFHCFDTPLCPGERLGLATMLKRRPARRCARRRTLRVATHPRVRVERVVARALGRRIGVSRGRRVVVRLGGIKRSSVRVRLRARGTRAGQRIHFDETRRVRICRRVGR